MKLPKIGAIVVNYNNPKDTRETIESLLRSANPKHFTLTIYLVNNGCTAQGSRKLASSLPQVTLIDSPVNLGFAGGNNLGITRALKENSTHILLINNDATVISKHFFETLLQSPFYLTAPLLISRVNGQLTPDYGGQVDYFLGRNTHLSAPGFADYYSGACLFINSLVLKKIKGFDESFFLYYEDVDFCLRAKKAGFTLGLLPQLKVFHRLSASTNKLGAKKIKILAQSHRLFCFKHLSPLSYPFYTLFNLYLNSKRIISYLTWKKGELYKDVYPFLNKIYCSFYKTPELHLIGDSHVWSYYYTHPFIVHHLGAATAYNLSNPNSSTQSYQKLQSKLQTISKKRSLVIFELGEIDSRLHIYNQFCKNNKKVSLKQIIAKTINNYLKVVEETAMRGFKVAILSPTPAGTENNRYEKDFFADFKTRSKITKHFHHKLLIESQKRQLPYINLYSLVSTKKGGIRKFFRQDEVHLNNKVVSLTLNLLKKQKLLTL